jgi:hypothetical protein
MNGENLLRYEADSGFTPQRYELANRGTRWFASV